MKFKNSTTQFPVGLFFSALTIALILSACNQKTSEKQDSFNTTSDNDGKQYFTDTASSSVKVFDNNGRVCIQQSNTGYEMVNVYDGATKMPLLLKIRKTELCDADSLNKKKVFEISARSVMDSKKIGWETKFVATNIQFSGNSLLAVLDGGDDADDFMKRFSLLDGKEVFSCSYGDLKIAIPNVRDKMFIGYTSRRAITEPLKDLKEENLLGVVRFGSSISTGNAIKVKLKRTALAAKMPMGTPDMILVAANEDTKVIEDGKTIILLKADEHYKPADVKDFAAKFTMYYGDDNESSDISIPVVDDKLDLKGAKYDHDLFDLSYLP